jgi:multiple sugar transport system substrate-binding protein
MMKGERPEVRRSAYLGTMGISVLIVFCFGLIGGICLAEERTTIRFATYRSTKAELNLYDQLVKDFEAAYPDIHVEIEPLSFRDGQTYIIGAIAAHSEPEVITMYAPMAPHYAKTGHLEPITDVFNALGGREDFFPAPLDLATYKADTYALILNLNGAVHWYRKDLFAQQGLKPPETWDDLLRCAKVLTQDTDGDGTIDMYGTVVPYGGGSCTAWYFEALLWSNGGRICDNNLDVVFDSPENAETLAFMKELAKYSPPGSSQFSFAELMNTFVVGKAATTWYWGRLLDNVEQKNPAIADKIGAVLIRKKNRVYKGGMDTIGVMKNSPHPELGKKFLQFFMKSDHYLKSLHTPAGQFFPSRRSAAKSETFLSHPLFKKHPDLIHTLQEAAANTAMFTWEPGGIVNPYANPIETAHVIDDVVQRVLIKGESPQEALAWGATKMREIIKQAKAKETQK